MNTLKPFFTFSHSSCMYSLREDALHFSKHCTLFFQSFEPSLFWKCKRPCCILFKQAKKEATALSLSKQGRMHAYYFLFMRLSFLSPHTHGSMQHTFIECECSMLTPSSMKEALIFLSNKNAQKMLPSLLEESFKRVQFLSSYFSSSTFFTY